MDFLSSADVIGDCNFVIIVFTFSISISSSGSSFTARPTNGSDNLEVQHRLMLGEGSSTTCSSIFCHICSVRELLDFRRCRMTMISNKPIVAIHTLFQISCIKIVAFFDYLELKIRRVEFGYVPKDSSIQNIS